ncbi:MAG: DNA lyase, partial [Spirochaetes bacterium]|nr:DNA lyase [Spirochaetota bacterium]
MENIESLKKEYQKIKKDIINRLETFQKTGSQGSDIDLFIEMVFCLLTPQAKARSCAEALDDLVHSKKLYIGNEKEISVRLNRTRFKNKKAEYIINVRNRFLKNGKVNLRSWLFKEKEAIRIRENLVKNIKGMGYKEASHYLRNIGLGHEMAILDRHVLKSL